MILEWLPAAKSDFAAVIDFIARDNLFAAIEQGDEIERQVAQLVEHPSMGRIGWVETTRELVISRTPFIAVYRIEQNRIQILRILHGARMWP